MRASTVTQAVTQDCNPGVPQAATHLIQAAPRVIQAATLRAQPAARCISGAGGLEYFLLKADQTVQAVGGAPTASAAECEAAVRARNLSPATYCPLLEPGCNPAYPGCNLTYIRCDAMCSGCNPMHPRLQPYAPQALLSAARHLGGRRHLRALAAAAATCRLACGHRPTALLLLRHAWCRGHRRHRRGQCGGWGAAGAAGAGSYLHVQRRQAALRRECITCAQDAHIAGSRSCHMEGARKGSGWDGVCGG